MNIVLLGHHDLASLYALNRVITMLPEHNCSVLLSGGLRNGPAGNAALAELEKADAELCDRFLSGAMHASIAPQLSTPPHALSEPNSVQGLGILRDLEPALIVSIRYRRILYEEAIAVPRHGVINLHSGILPNYRGVMATFWAMLEDEKEIGTTLHRIVDSGIDTGPVIGIRRRAVRVKMSYLGNVIGLYAEGCEMIMDAVRAVAAGRKLPGNPQAARGRYFRTPGPRDIRRFEAKGLTLFDGREEAEIDVQDPMP